MAKIIEPNHPDPFMSYERDGAVKTRYRIKAWWLCTFGGYRVMSVSQFPANTLYGGIRYTKTWWLTPPRTTHNGQHGKR